MQNSKLIRLLTSLQREEFRRFGQFLHSPFFNTNEKFVALYNYIARYYPGLFSPKLSKEKAFAALFPKETYDDNRMRQIMFRMTKLAEDFLAVQVVWNDEGRKTQLLTEALGSRKLHPYFEKAVKAETKKLEAVQYKDLPTLHRLLFYNHQYFFHPDTPKFKAGIKSIEDCMKYLDDYFAQAKLQYACELIARSAALKEEHQIWLLQEVMKTLEGNKAEEEDSLTALYYMLTLLQRDRDNELLFKGIKRKFLDIVAELPQQERIDFYQQLSNYTIAKINAGNRAYLLDFFELTEVALAFDIIVEKDRITDATFTNVVAIAAALKKFEWTAQFIKDYEKRLASSVRESASQLAWAYWYYHKGAFSDVLTCLQEVDFLPSYGFRVKSLRLRSYFELFQQDDSYLDPLMADIHSFDLYIRRHKAINSKRRTTYLNFIKFTKKLIRLKTNATVSDAEKEKLSSSIQQKEPIVVKHWLLEKLKEL